MKKKPNKYIIQHSDHSTVRIQDASSSNNNLIWLPALLIAFITFLVYLPALQNGFVNWDDDLYVYENPNIRSLDFTFLKWCLKAVVVGPWTPLTMFSFGVDYALWELNPWGYHLVNVLFHALNTVLVFILSIQLLKHGSPKEPWQTKELLIISTVTALLFGVHPLHVESVAWVTERKDVLSAFFYILSIIFYLKYTSVSQSKPIFYIACLGSFALALISKPMSVSLPIVLLIVDFYPLRRFKKEVLLEKLPFFALSLLTGLITIWSHISLSGGIKTLEITRLAHISSAGAMKTLEELPLITRAFVAVRAYIFYLYKMILPLNLAPLYPYPKGIDIYSLEYIAALILFAIATFFCIRLFNRNRLFFSIWSYYIATLIPVIGLLQAGHQMGADRFTYLPSIGPFLLVGLGVGRLFERYSGRSRKALIISLSLLTALLINMTVTQIALWKDSITLWSHEIRLFPNISEIAYHNRGYAYVKSGRYQEAISDYNIAVEIEPRYAEAYYSRGNAYLDLGNYMQAITDYNTAIKLNPEHINAYYNRGNAYKKLGMYQEAISDYSMAVQINPKYVEAFNNRGNTYIELRDAPQAIRDYNTAIQLDPRYIETYINRGNIYNVMGDFQEAISNYNRAIELNPRNAAAYSNRGLAYGNLKDHQQAVKDFTAAIELNPKNSIAYKLRGISYGNMGSYQQALLDLRVAVELNPQDTEAQYYLRLAQDKEK